MRTSTDRCNSAGRVTARLLLSFLALSTPIVAHITDSGHNVDLGLDEAVLPAIPPIFPGELDSPARDPERFTLRHIYHHGAYKYPKLHRRRDVLNPEAQLFATSDDGRPMPIPPLMIRSQQIQMQRLADRRPSIVDPMIRAARETGDVWQLSPSAWTVDEIPAPNVTDKETVVNLAEMAAAAYVQDPHMSDWINITQGYNSSMGFGWEGDGIRGHIWANEGNSTIVISIKGTTTRVFDGDETSTGDKENDNLFFSCCCGQQGQLTWRKVCDCATGTYTCNNTCVTKALRQEHRYYTAAKELYTNVTELYPNSTVWMSGHSLGGSVASLLGMTYGLPTVSFEAPPDNLAAKRLGLPLPPGDPRSPKRHGYTGTYHFGHTADPVFLGTCNGITSTCSFAGYAMESACHTGKECVYDVVGDKGWRVAITTHSIRSVIDNVLMAYDTVPKCEQTPECVDCPLWKFYESNSSETTTSRSSTKTRTMTRTETCKTPGWWGCLDETTATSGTATTTRPVTTTTASTTTCHTPGWFGCYDKTTTTAATTSKTTTSSKHHKTGKPSGTTSSTTCLTPGWFGCYDDTTTKHATSTCNTPGWWGCRDGTRTHTRSHPITSPVPLPSSPPPPQPTATSTTTCTSKEWFGLICVDPSPDAKLPEFHSQPKQDLVCAKRGWFFMCNEWVDLNDAGVLPEDL